LVQEQSLKFSIKVVNNTAAAAVQFAKCILLHAYLLFIYIQLQLLAA